MFHNHILVLRSNRTSPRGDCVLLMYSEGQVTVHGAVIVVDISKFNATSLHKCSCWYNRIIYTKYVRMCKAKSEKKMKPLLVVGSYTFRALCACTYYLCQNCTTDQGAKPVELTTTVEEPGFAPHSSQWLFLASDNFIYDNYTHTHTHARARTHAHTHTHTHTLSLSLSLSLSLYIYIYIICGQYCFVLCGHISAAQRNEAEPDSNEE